MLNKKNISEADWNVRVDLAAMFRLTNMMVWDDAVWNHIAARAPETDHTFFMHQMGFLSRNLRRDTLKNYLYTCFWFKELLSYKL